jgi:hypothetical protein
MRTLWTFAVVGLLVVGCSSAQEGSEGAGSDVDENIAVPDIIGSDFIGAGEGGLEDSSEWGTKDVEDEIPDDTLPIEDAGIGEGDVTEDDASEDDTWVEQDVVVDPCGEEANDCSSLNLEAGGCVKEMICDPDYTDAEGSHCKPVFKPNGSPCIGVVDGNPMTVVAASEPATDTAASVCDRFLCYGEAEATPQCVQASTLSTTTQLVMENEGFFVKHECPLEGMPSDISMECNDWLCGCATASCLDAQCGAVGDHYQLNQPCDAADQCSSGTCVDTPDGSYSCEQEPVVCPAVPDAWCVEMPSCNAENGGCSETMDAALSDANCAVDDPCLLSAVCDPENEAVDAATGCVLTFDDPESGCGDGIVGITAGGSFTLAFEADGTLHWWGIQSYEEPPEGVLFAQVAAGKTHACGVDKGNNLYCWGIQDGGNWDYGQVALTPTEGKFIHAAAGYNHSCAVREDGVALCWGIGSEDNLTPDQEPYEKGQVKLTPTEAVFQQIGTGHSHSCALKTDGTLACWGNGNAMANMPAGSDFVSLSVGFHHNCAIDSQGGMICWGWTAFGLVEDTPEGTFQSVSCGYGHTCAVRTTGEVVCWGVPDKAEGAPPVSDNGQATDAPLTANFTHVGVSSSHSCAVTTDDKVVCWGSNGGNKATPPPELQP